MSDMNQCNFTGRLGKDVEIRYMTDGKAVANLSIAVGSTWRDKRTGEKKERTEWVNISTYGRLAEIAGEHLKKGSHIRVTGEMRTRKWQDKSGQDRYTTEIIANEMQMLGGRNNSDTGQQGGYQQQPQQDHRAHQGSNQQNPTYAPQQQQGGGFDDFDDDIPF